MLPRREAWPAEDYNMSKKYTTDYFTASYGYYLTSTPSVSADELFTFLWKASCVLDPIFSCLLKGKAPKMPSLASSISPPLLGQSQHTNMLWYLPSLTMTNSAFIWVMRLLKETFTFCFLSLELLKWILFTRNKYLTPIRMATIKIKIKTENRYWQGCGEIATQVHRW